MVFAVVKRTAQGNAVRNKTKQKNTRKKEKEQKLKICRRAKNHGAIRQAV